MAPKYSAKLQPGDKRVAITSPKVIGKKKMYDTPDSPVVDVTEELLPKRYNAQSELTLTVKLGNQDAPPFVLVAGQNKAVEVDVEAPPGKRVIHGATAPLGLTFPELGEFGDVGVEGILAKNLRLIVNELLQVGSFE